MENLQKLNLLECDTNTVYELEVTPEIYARATMDMVFATNLLKRSVHEGRTVFELESFELGENTEEYEFSSIPGPSTSKSMGKKRPVQDENDLKAGKS
ncbi:unnamed protein product [Euphydryas editha]|uniref:Uncharacterized protein n=1 Tax=Euphydryas editha TaxID=104508 RepID=A0AAU9UT12_EUPED|nr:unnamed protein product [Euphydryas editha]